MRETWWINYPLGNARCVLLGGTNHESLNSREGQILALLSWLGWLALILVLKRTILEQFGFPSEHPCEDLLALIPF